MDSVQAVTKVLEGLLDKQRAARLSAIVSKRKGQRKFLDELCHGIESHVRSDIARQADLSQCESLPCYVYSEREGFGVSMPTMGEAYEALSVKDSWLIVAQDGTFAVYRPEARWDAEIICAI